MSSNAGSCFDVWVQRISHLSQLGLLILATFGYFYTVRPIYTKSMLEEEIAKKQIEIKEKDNKMIESNKLITIKQQELKKTIDQANSATSQLASAKRSLDKTSQELATIQRQLYDSNNDLYATKDDLDKSKYEIVKSKSAAMKYYSQLKKNVVKNVLWSNSNCAQEPMDLYNIKFTYNRIGKCINEISSKAEILNALEPKDKQHFLKLLSSIDKTTGTDIDKIQAEYESFYKIYKNKEKDKDSKLSSWTLNDEEKGNIIRSSIDEHFDMNKKLEDRYRKVIEDAFKEIERQFLEN